MIAEAGGMAVSPSEAPLLSLERVTMQFGGLKAVADVDLQIPAGELFGLIGPNGAGKTTIFNLITGVYAPTSGRILFEGQPIQGKKPHVIARRGIAFLVRNITLSCVATCVRGTSRAPEHGASGMERS